MKVTVCISPTNLLLSSRDTEVSAAVPTNYEAAAFLRLRLNSFSTFHQYNLLLGLHKGTTTYTLIVQPCFRMTI